MKITVKLKENKFKIAGSIYITIYLLSAILGYWVSMDLRQQLGSAGIEETTSQPLNYDFIFGTGWYYLAGGILNFLAYYYKLKKKSKILSVFIILSPFFLFLIYQIIFLINDYSMTSRASELEKINQRNLEIIRNKTG
jgi:hypothetical protein